MDKHLSASGERIVIGGIRFSVELVHYRHHQLSPVDRSLADLLRAIAERRINMPFFCSGREGELASSSFCVAAADALQVDQVVLTLDAGPATEAAPAMAGRLAKIERVGTLTLFPHRHSPGLLGRVVAALAGAHIAIHSLCTSISALSVNIDFDLLDRAAAILQPVVSLPEHHAPFRPEFAVLQIKR